MPEAESPPPNPAKGRLVLWLAGLGVPLLLLLAWWPSGKPRTRPTLPNPNGYDLFLKAAACFSASWTNASLRTMPVENLRALVATNAPLLDLVREGLTLGSHTHVDFDASFIGRMNASLGPLKRLGVTLNAEGLLAELEARPAAALRSHLDSLRFGQESSRGGLIIERLVGIANEQIGLTHLRPLIPLFDAADCKSCVEELVALDRRHDPPAVNLASEDAWIQGAFPLGQRLATRFHPTLVKGQREVRTSFIEKVNRLQTERRRAIIEAAARLFELEKGRRPTGYADLVPAYLKAVPLDPATGKEIAHPF